jgi:hypothetical protein
MKYDQTSKLSFMFLYDLVTSITALSVGIRSPLDPAAYPTASEFAIEYSAEEGSLKGPPWVKIMTCGFISLAARQMAWTISVASSNV